MIAWVEQWVPGQTQGLTGEGEDRKYEPKRIMYAGARSADRPYVLKVQSD